MSDTSDEVVGTPGVDNGNSEPAGNPAWQDILNLLPDSLHSVVTPELEKWDRTTNAKFSESADQLKAYEPYQPFIEAQVDPDQMEQALAVAQLIDQDPKAFMEQMKAFFGEEEPAPATSQQQNNDDDDGSFDTQPFDLSTDPNFKQIAEQQDLIAGFLQQQVEERNANLADQQLEEDVQTLKQKYGEFDEDYVFGLALNGVDLEDGVKRYLSLTEGIRNRPTADNNLPNIVTPGGGMPNEQINPADMSDAERKALVMSVLRQANQQT